MSDTVNKKINRILVVDDEEDICYLIKSILTRVSTAKIDICTTVKEAKDRINNNQYELTFFDIRLNDGSGKDLINYLHKETDYEPYIAVISAYTSYEDILQLNAIQYDTFIAKPLSREKILTCLRNATQ